MADGLISSQLSGLGTCNAYGTGTQACMHACMSRNAASGQLTQPQPYSVLRVSQIRSRRGGFRAGRAEHNVLLLLTDHSCSLVRPSEEPRHAAFTGAAFGWHSAHAMQMRSVSGCCCFPVLYVTSSQKCWFLQYCHFYFLFSDVPSFSHRINNCWGVHYAYFTCCDRRAVLCRST